MCVCVWLCVCVCVCMWLCVSVCLCVYVFVYVNTRLYICGCAFVRVCSRACTRVCVCGCLAVSLWERSRCRERQITKMTTWSSGWDRGHGIERLRVRIPAVAATSFVLLMVVEWVFKKLRTDRHSNRWMWQTTETPCATGVNGNVLKTNKQTNNQTKQRQTNKQKACNGRWQKDNWATFCRNFVGN